MSAKITPDHLRRRAVVYVRQSTAGQVVNNLESQRRQYGLADRAKEIGFTEIDVIDDDLGRSGSGLTARPGFERLVGMVCASAVGAVFCIEASRLARNGRDWHRLLDFCALVGTLLIDPDGVYDPRSANDRLLLGLKGTMSEFEVTLFRQRSFDAIRAKAQRGELQFRLPVGVRWSEEGRIEIDPDRRVQASIRSVFEQFNVRGSVRQVLLAMRAEKLTVPAIREGDRTHQVEWKLPVYNTILKFLTNPIYAGAYAYGRTETRTHVVAGRGEKTSGHRKSRGDWTVLIRDHHAGYITWEQFERNQNVVADNTHMRKSMSPKAGRGGKALLAGLLRCRRCGRMVHVVYGGRGEPTARYECRGANINHGEGSLRCMAFGSLRPDEAVARALLEVVSPQAIDAAIELAGRMANEETDVHRAVSLELEQARYEARLAARRYESVDPDNRLVASELEARWNGSLSHVREMETRLADIVQSRTRSASVDREALLTLGDSLPSVWNSPIADMRLKQRIARLLIKEIVADVDASRSETVLLIHWRGGRHTEIRAAKNKVGQHSRTTAPEVEDVVRRMAGRWPNVEIASTLNRLRTRTGTGLTWNDSRVQSLRNRLGLGSQRAALENAPNTLSLQQAVERLGVSNTVVLRFIREGLLAATQCVPNAPYEIAADALDDPALLAAIRRTRERGKHARAWSADRKTLPLPGIQSAKSASRERRS